MVTTVTDNSPQSINTSLFSLDKEVQEIKKVTDKLSGINPEANVISVNGKQGIVELNASDVKALPDTTVIPTTTSELENTSGFITSSDSITGNAATASTADKVKNALTVNGKTYDGSSAVDAGVQTIANGGTGVTTQADINKAFIANLEEGESDVTDGTEFVSSWASDNGFAETAEGDVNKPYKRKFSKVWNYIKDKISSVLGLTANNYGGKSAKSSFLDEYVGAGGTRPTSGNIVPKDASEYGGMRKDVVTTSMTDSGHPGQDGHLLTMFWDNSGRYDSQFFVSNEKQPLEVKVRTKANEADYGPWVDLITSQSIGSQTVAKAETADKAVEVVDYGDTSRIVKVGYLGPSIQDGELSYLAGYTGLNGNSIKIKDVDANVVRKWLGIPRIRYADYQTPTQTFTQFQQVPIELSKFSSEVTPTNVLCFMVIYWSGVQLIASADWGNPSSSGLKCALIALQAGTGAAIIRCVYMV